MPLANPADTSADTKPASEPPPANPADTSADAQPQPAEPAADAKLDARGLARLIDQHVATKLKANQVTPSPLADDAEFLRRLYLDLHGVVPPAEKVASFLDSREPNKRARLIDELLASEQYGKHFADIWISLLIPNRGFQGRPTEPLENWLAQRFNRNQPWNLLVGELLTATGKLEDNPASRYFLDGPNSQLSLPDLTNSVSSLFLGVQLKCAQCHNHPFASWTKADYWGLAGFFTNINYKYNQQGVFDDTKVNLAKGKAAFIDDDSKARLLPARFLLGDAPPMTGSIPGRKVFADWLTARDNPYLARATVNRWWFHFFGRGLVQPVDDLRSDNPPSHPELFEDLREQFVANGFDLKHLIRGICNSRTYQRSSRPADGNDSGPLYGHMAIKVLTAEQLFDSLAAILGTSNQRGGGRDPRRDFIDLFKSPEPDPTSYSRGMTELLRLMNSPQYQRGRDALVDQAMKRGPSPAAVVEYLYLAALSRRPSAVESQRMLTFVKQAGDARLAYGQILWVLMNSSEFMLNH